MGATPALCWFDGQHSGSSRPAGCIVEVSLYEHGHPVVFPTDALKCCAKPHQCCCPHPGRELEVHMQRDPRSGEHASHCHVAATEMGIRPPALLFPQANFKPLHPCPAGSEDCRTPLPPLRRTQPHPPRLIRHARASVQPSDME